MIHPIPSGTRDVLPDEMRELRAITDALRGVFEDAATARSGRPALEYESVLERPAAAPGVYRMFDDHGEMLALRSDMTVPIARVVGTRYATPSRRCASATSPTPTGRSARTAGSRASSCRPGSSSSARPRPTGRRRR